MAHSQCILTQGCLSPGAPPCRSLGSSHLFFTPLQPEFHFCACRHELPAAPLCFRFSIGNEVECCVLSNFILSFFLLCCWSITWRLSVPACPFKSLELECLCQQQQRHVPGVDSPGQVGPHTDRASVHLLSYLIVYTTCSLNDPQPGGRDLEQGCDLDQPDISPTPLAAFVCWPVLPRAVKAAKQLSQGPGLLLLMQKCCGERVAAENTPARAPSWLQLHAGRRMLQSPQLLLSAVCLGVLSALARGSVGSVACLLVTFPAGLTGY